jgi:medium-chain acyl-[acyl-carrier-protein] hydrolase
MKTLADRLVEALLPVVPQRWVLAGHCSGSYLAWEVAHRIVAAGRPPLRLVLSSSRPPYGLANPRSEESRSAAEILALSSQALVQRMDDRGLLPAEGLDPEVAAAMLGAYRAAVSSAAGYRCDRPPIQVATEVWRGVEDTVVSEQHARGWSTYTATPPEFVTFAGSREHFERPQPEAARRIARILEVKGEME